LLPRAAFKYYQKTQRAQLLINWLYQGNKDMAQIERILAQPAAIWPPGSGAIAETRSDFNDFTNVAFKVEKRPASLTYGYGIQRTVQNPLCNISEGPGF
jgi:hypothetical protein